MQYDMTICSLQLFSEHIADLLIVQKNKRFMKIFATNGCLFSQKETTPLIINYH